MRAAIAVTLLAGAVAACQHKVVHHPGEEWLAAIDLEGNHAFKSKDIRQSLALYRAQEHGGSPDPYLVTVDADRIKGMYVRRGYLEVDVRSRVERKGEATRVIYTIVEGQRATTRIRIIGIPNHDPELTEAHVRDTLPLHDGAPFNYEPYDKAKEPLLGIAQDAGYAHAQLDSHVDVDRTKHEAVINLVYSVGPKCRFGAVRIRGVPPELEDAVRDRITFEPGDQFSSSAIAATQRALYDMQRFSTVRVFPNKSDGDVVDVTISLARASRNELSLGGGVGMDPAAYEVRARTGYSILSWPFPLTDFSVDLRPAYAMLRDGSGYEPRVRALASLRRLDLFRPYMIGQVAAGYNYLVVESYTSYGPVARLGLETPIGSAALKVRVGWQIERLDFRHINPLIDPATEHMLGLDQTERVGQYTQAVVLDLRDHPQEPRFGVYAETRVSEGTSLAGGAFDYVEVTPEVRGYVPVPLTPAVLAARVRYGTFYGEVPVTERYYSGGASTHRGFSERRLAPTIVQVEPPMHSIPIGGTTLFESNIELRSEIGKVRGMGVGGALFLDGGDVTEARSQLDLGNLHWALGAGLRVFTLLGAVRFDLGYRLNRTGLDQPEPGSHYAFHLSIGEAY